MKFVKGLLCAAGATILALSVASCGGSNSDGFDTSKTITKYTRDTTSGTREGFFEKIDFKDAQKNDSVISSAVTVTGNGTMLSSVAGDEYSIGYASLASVSDNLKKLNFEGVEATEENVINGTYNLKRSFNYITRTTSDMSETEAALIKGFSLYMFSKEGLAIIKDNDGIIATNAISQAESWTTIVEKSENADVKSVCSATSKTTIYFGGSTSVEKMAKALTTAYAGVCSGFSASHNHTGSGDAYSRTQGSDKDSQNKLHVGFLSRDLKLSSSEAAQSGTYGTMCQDGIAVIVNTANTAVSNITAAQLKQIYSTANIKWSDIVA